MNKIKKILLAIPVFFITLYSKVRANNVVNFIVPTPETVPLYGVYYSRRNKIFKLAIYLAPIILVVCIALGINIFLKKKYKKYSENKRIIKVISVITSGVIIFFLLRYIYKNY